MDREVIEKEINDISESIRKLIDEAYMCGYKDGYCGCINAKVRVNNEDKERKTIQLSTAII